MDVSQKNSSQILYDLLEMSEMWWWGVGKYSTGKKFISG